MFKRFATAGLLPALVVSAVLAMAFMAPPGTTRLAVSCGYGYPPCPPTVTSVAPDRGSTDGAITVTITGTNFTGATDVSFGGTPATSFVVVNDTTITAVVPAHAVGVVDVTVTTPVATSAISAADQYHYLPLSIFKPTQPERLWDTRITGVHLHGGDSLTFQVAGVGTVPANATAVTLNVTVTNTSAAGFLTVYPTGAPRPVSSNLNWVTHLTVPNLVDVAIGDGGQVTFYNGIGTTDVVVDLEGWYEPQSSTSDGEYNALAPHRITDTRTGSGQLNAGAHLGPGGHLDMQVRGEGGVRSTGSESVIMNVTVVNTSTASFITAYPTGTTRPLASNLNWTRGMTVPNRVSVPIGANGKVTLYNGYGSVDVVVDVNGWFTDDLTNFGSFFLPLTPDRILDTRNGTGGFSSKVGPGQTIAVQVAGRGGVPDMVSANPPDAVVINVTATRPTTPGFLTIFPNGIALPLASDLNFLAGQTRPNLVIVRLGGDGKVAVYNGWGSTDVVFDIVGWYDTSNLG
jgi:hypothetical protein